LTFQVAILSGKVFSLGFMADPVAGVVGSDCIRRPVVIASPTLLRSEMITPAGYRARSKQARSEDCPAAALIRIFKRG
jgi:hypothetical protein